MLKLVLIRHGKTAGNVQRRYVGRTDEGLCPAGREALTALQGKGLYPSVTAVFASPMRRCLETAALLYPQKNCNLVPGLQECDFGSFEYQTYEELKTEVTYQHWLASNGQGEIPGGESATDFRSRCEKTFALWLEERIVIPQSPVALVVHGGVIMALLARFAQPKQDFYTWQVENGRGFVVTAEHWQEKRQLTVIEKL